MYQLAFIWIWGSFFLKLWDSWTTFEEFIFLIIYALVCIVFCLWCVAQGTTQVLLDTYNDNQLNLESVYNSVRTTFYTNSTKYYIFYKEQINLSFTWCQRFRNSYKHGLALFNASSPHIMYKILDSKCIHIIGSSRPEKFLWSGNNKSDEWHEDEDLPTWVGYDKKLAEELPWDGLWQFVLKFFGGDISWSQTIMQV